MLWLDALLPDRFTARQKVFWPAQSDITVHTDRHETYFPITVDSVYDACLACVTTCETGVLQAVQEGRHDISTSIWLPKESGSSTGKLKELGFVPEGGQLSHAVL